MQNASYFHHLVSWWEHRNDPDVLFLFYEDLKEDLAGNVEKICGFLDLDEPEERCRTAVAHSSFAFMSSHSAHFDERHSKIARNSACGLSADAGLGNGKVRDGKMGSGRPALSAELALAIEIQWKDVVGKATGCDTYQSLRDLASKECAKQACG